MNLNSESSGTILHVIERLSLGGAARCLLALAVQLKQRGFPKQRVLSLLEPDPQMRTCVQAAGINVVFNGDKGSWAEECSAAAIVQLYFWNSPSVYDFLEHDLPAMRLIVWLQVNCLFAPHALTDQIIASATAIISSTSVIPSERQAHIMTSITSACDFERLKNFQARSHSGFNVGYIGTVDPLKMHPSFLQLSAAIEIPEVRFQIYGSGDHFKSLSRQAQQLGIGERIQLMGYSENIGRALAEFDLFGYPLCEDNYSTSCLVLQEALYCGIPAVVLPHGGAASLVINNKTGFIVHSAKEYKEAIEYLFRNPDTLAKMKSAASSYAREHFGAEKAAQQFIPVYKELLKSEKSQKCTNKSASKNKLSGASRFIKSTGDFCPCLSISLFSDDQNLLQAADEEIANLSAVVVSSSGGILDYARYYKRDPHLRLWTGLILERQGRIALALGEYHKAKALGLREKRLEEYIQRSREKLQENAQAQSTLNSSRQI